MPARDRFLREAVLDVGKETLRGHPIARSREQLRTNCACRKGPDLVERHQRLAEIPGLPIRNRQPHPCKIEIGIELEPLQRLLDGPVIFAVVQEQAHESAIYDRRGWI